MREIFRLNNSQTVKGKDILVVARNQAGKASYDRLNKDYMKLLRHHGIYEELK
jgi:ribonuclease P protein component